MSILADCSTCTHRIRLPRNACLADFITGNTAYCCELQYVNNYTTGHRLFRECNRARLHVLKCRYEERAADADQ